MAIYLDYNASAPIEPRALTAMVDVYQNQYGNADSRTHTFGTEAKGVVIQARKTIADILGVNPMDFFFTSGSTESNNMAILGLLEHAQKTGRNHFITTSIEHKSVLEPMKYLQNHGCTVDFVSPDKSGRVSAQEILSRVTDKTLLVSVMHVNSETGVMQPIQEIGAALKESGTYFHVDGTQGFGKCNETLQNTWYDMLSITSHKVGGPQGIGGFVCRRDSSYKRPPIQPLFLGGQQERGFRPGTTPVALAVGFATAAQIAHAEEKAHTEACVSLKTQFLDAIAGLQYTINGEPSYTIPSTINISFHGVDAESIFVAMKDDYACSNGSACNSGSHNRSYVLTAMGLPEEQIDEAIRLSWGADTKVDFSALVNYVRDFQ